MFNAKVSIVLLYAILFLGTITASIPNNLIDTKANEESQYYPPSDSYYPDDETEDKPYQCRTGPFEGFFVSSVEFCDVKEKHDKDRDNNRDNKTSEPTFDVSVCENAFLANLGGATEEEVQNVTNNFAIVLNLTEGADITDICTAIDDLIPPNATPEQISAILQSLSIAVQNLPTSGPNEDAITAGIINTIIGDSGLPPPPPIPVSQCTNAFLANLGGATEQERQNVLNNFKIVLNLPASAGITEICIAIDDLIPPNATPEQISAILLDLCTEVQNLPTSGPTEDAITAGITNALFALFGLPPPPPHVDVPVTKLVECSIDTNFNLADTQQECDLVLGTGSTTPEGDVTAGNFGPVNYDMIFNNNNLGGPGPFEVPHTLFQQVGTDGVATALVVAGQTYSIGETAAAAGTANAVPITPVTTADAPAGCVGLANDDPLNPRAVIGVGTIPPSQSVICALTSVACATNLVVDGIAPAPECEVENVILSAQQAAGALEIAKAVECEITEVNVTRNQEACDFFVGTGSTNAEGAVTAGAFAPTNYDMTLTDNSNPPNVFVINHTQFVLNPDNEGVTLAAVPPGTYKLAETQIATTPPTPIQTTTPIPVGCQNLAADESAGAPIGFTAVGFANLPNGGVMCVIMDNICAVNGIGVGTTDAECEVANVVMSAEQAAGIPIGVSKSAGCSIIGDDDVANKAACDAILGAGSTLADGDGPIVAGQFAPTNYDMTLTDTALNVIPIPHTKFELDVDEGFATAYVQPGSTYKLAETFIATTPTPTQILIAGIPTVCQDAAAEISIGEPIGFTATGFVNLPGPQPGTGDDAVLCVVMDNNCGVNGLPIEITSVRSECAVENVVVPAG